MNTKINAKIVAHSVNLQGDELISVLCTFPRIILAEVNTHRMLSKNTSSSRAIPFEKLLEKVQNDPFIPIAWQKDHKGMQGTDYFTEAENYWNIDKWLKARDSSIKIATQLNEDTVTKQLCNRLLEPFMWTTMLITGSKEGWDNFFKLRCPQYVINVGGGHDVDDDVVAKSWKDLMLNKYTGDFATDNIVERLSYNKGQAEIHMMALAEAIWDAKNESVANILNEGEWHIPFIDKIQKNIEKYKGELYPDDENIDEIHDSSIISEVMVRISTAMAARTSYTVVGDEKEVNYTKMIELHDKLINQNPPHSSPMEHCAKAMTSAEYWYYTKQHGKGIAGVLDNNTHINQGWCRNYKGFIQYRHLIENGNTL